MIRRLLFFACILNVSGCALPSEQLSESFDEDKGASLYVALAQTSHAKVRPRIGVGKSNGLKVTYQGYERGSKRALLYYPIPDSGLSYKLTFDVMFCEGFDFARGGKLHGLGPKDPVTGGYKVTPNSWSARGIWLANGGLATYLYHQNLPHKYGTSKNAKGFKFETGKYYRVTYDLKLNYPSEVSNGHFKISVNGEEKVSHDGIQFRSSSDSSSLIQSFLFNTFHGGSTPKHAPRDAQGNYKVDCAYFDNFRVE